MNRRHQPSSRRKCTRSPDHSHSPKSRLLAVASNSGRIKGCRGRKGMPLCVKRSCCGCIPIPGSCSTKRRRRCCGRTCWPRVHQRALHRSRMVQYDQESAALDTGCCCCCCIMAHYRSAQHHHHNIHRRHHRCRCRRPPALAPSVGMPAAARTVAAPDRGGCWRTSPNDSLRGYNQA